MKKLLLIILTFGFTLYVSPASGSDNFCNSYTAPSIPGYQTPSCDSAGNSYSVAVLVSYPLDNGSSTHEYKLQVSILNSVWDPLNFGSGTCYLKRDKRRGTSHEYATVATFAVPTSGSFEKDLTIYDSFVERKNYEVTYTLSCPSNYNWFSSPLNLSVWHSDY